MTWEQHHPATATPFITMIAPHPWASGECVLKLIGENNLALIWECWELVPDRCPPYVLFRPI